MATVGTSCPSITTRPTSLVISSEVSRALTASSRLRISSSQHLRTDHGRDVLRVLEASVIHERDEPVLLDPRVRGEQQSDLHRVAPERVDRQRPTRVQRREVVEEDPVDLVQPLEAERPLGTFRRPAERQLAGDGGEGAHRGQVEPPGGLRVRHELIGVHGRRRGEQREPAGPEQPGGLPGNLGGICGRFRVRVQEQEQRRQVLRLHVDGARLEGILRDLSRPQVELSLDGVAGVLQDLRVHLRDDLVLGEGAGHADDDHLIASGGRERRPARIGVGATCRDGAHHHHGGRRAQEADPPDGSGEFPRCGHSTSEASGAMIGTSAWRPSRTRTVVGPLPFTSRISGGPKS